MTAIATGEETCAGINSSPVMAWNCFGKQQNVLMQPLSLNLLHNLCINLSIFPGDFKWAQIIPLHNQLENNMCRQLQASKYFKIFERPIY